MRNPGNQELEKNYTGLPYMFPFLPCCMPNYKEAVNLFTNNPSDLQHRLGKIDEKPVLLSQCLEIGFHNCEMDILDILCSFQFNDDRVSDYKIKPMLSNLDPIIFDDNFPLLFNLKIPLS
jgi:hypothetical protein